MASLLEVFLEVLQGCLVSSVEWESLNVIFTFWEFDHSTFTIAFSDTFTKFLESSGTDISAIVDTDSIATSTLNSLSLNEVVELVGELEFFLSEFFILGIKFFLELFTIGEYLVLWLFRRCEEFSVSCLLVATTWIEALSHIDNWSLIALLVKAWVRAVIILGNSNKIFNIVLSNWSDNVGPFHLYFSTSLSIFVLDKLSWFKLVLSSHGFIFILEFLKVLEEIFNKCLIDCDFDVESLEEIVNVESSFVWWVVGGWVLACKRNITVDWSRSFKKYLEDIFLLAEHLLKKSSVIYLSTE